ncbi:cyclin-D1-binding protein 1 homolog isoform X2 [Littorina saxatilis]|uniref:Uncharacterized protein n=1 Tax=Littorina saxatilis TaxID=31220 RepID=A0AAN9C1T7_9CAEN
MAAAGSHVNIFKNLEDNLKLVLEQIKGGETGRENKENFNFEKYWGHMGSVFELLSLEGSKFSLAFSSSPFPPIKDCEVMTANLEKLVLELVRVFYSLPKSQGLTLRKSLQRAVVEVVESMLGLVSSLAQLDPGAGERQQATGIVWEGANSFVTLPKSNKEAVQTSVEQSAGLVEDALTEIDEILNNEGRLEDIFGEEEEGGGENSEAWTAQDKELVDPTKGLLKVAVKLTEKAGQACKVKATCDSEAHVAQLDDLSDCAQRLSPAVDNLTASLYAPIDHTAVRNSATTLSEIIGNMLNILRHSHMTDEGDSKWLDFLDKANTHNLTTLTDILNK